LKGGGFDAFREGYAKCILGEMCVKIVVIVRNEWVSKGEEVRLVEDKAFDGAESRLPGVSPILLMIGRRSK